jgi:hypothetical protein
MRDRDEEGRHIIEAMDEAHRVVSDKSLPVAEKKRLIWELYEKHPLPAIEGYIETLTMQERA